MIYFKRTKSFSTLPTRNYDYYQFLSRKKIIADAKQLKTKTQAGVEIIDGMNTPVLPITAWFVICIIIIIVLMILHPI